MAEEERMRKEGGEHTREMAWQLVDSPVTPGP